MSILEKRWNTRTCPPNHCWSVGKLVQTLWKIFAFKVEHMGSIACLGKSPRGGHGNPIQYSCLENSHGQSSRAGYSPRGHKQSDTTKLLSIAQHSALKLNKQGDNIQPWSTPFPIWNQSIFPHPILTVASWPAYRFWTRQVKWSGIPISLRIFHHL